MTTVLMALLMLANPGQTANQVSEAQKQAFIELLGTLPKKGEFYANGAAQRARPYLPVLFALTEKDLEKYDLYPFLAISRALCEERNTRRLAAHDFARISHPKIKLFWAVMLFDLRSSTKEVRSFLKSALESREQADILAEMIGPDFEAFKKRLMAHNPERK